MSSAPVFSDAPKLINDVTFKTYTGITDFYFDCEIHYRDVTIDDGARFDAALRFDEEINESTIKTTTPLEKKVVFNSADLKGHFGKTVSKAILQSYPPVVK